MRMKDMKLKSEGERQNLIEKRYVYIHIASNNIFRLKRETLSANLQKEMKRKQKQRRNMLHYRKRQTQKPKNLKSCGPSFKEERQRFETYNMNFSENERI
jgi:UDP-N-acetylenolpyruvoylglucosamine reductase